MADLRSRLIRWYRANRRDLPWRRTRDPYHVWISEVMLQQTRVDTVVPYYESFLKRWPSVDALARAPADEVHAAWSGLGYYRRARLMMRAAEAVVREHGGEIPGDVERLLELPGFGRYTAGAVASIAFDLEAPAVDGNVSRVLARIHAIEGDALATEQSRAIWAIAESLVAGDSPGDLNQALIELGAMVCTPRAPRCVACPVRDHCRALSAGCVDQIPSPRKRARRSTMSCTALISIADDGRILFEKQPHSGLFADLWCLPMLEGRLEADAIGDEAMRKYGLEIASAEIAAEVKHVLTHRDILMRVARVVLFRESEPRPDLRLLRMGLAELREAGVPSMTVRTLRAALPDHAFETARLPGRRSLSE
jgi:A/G-specific adenine glycosylase